MMRHHLHMPSYFLGTFTEYPYVARFQECVQGSSSAEKWQLMERLFYLYES